MARRDRGHPAGLTRKTRKVFAGCEKQFEDFPLGICTGISPVKGLILIRNEGADSSLAARSGGWGIQCSDVVAVRGNPPDLLGARGRWMRNAKASNRLPRPAIVRPFSSPISQSRPRP